MLFLNVLKKATVLIIVQRNYKKRNAYETFLYVKYSRKIKKMQLGGNDERQLFIKEKPPGSF